jgi:tetratricopeptide (TPR) repeat protein
MKTEEIDQATVVMETKAKKEEPAKEAQPEKKAKEKPAPKPKGEKKKIPLAAIIGGGIAVLVIIAVILTQVLNFGTTTPNTPAQPDTIPVVDAQPAEQDEVNGEELFHQGEVALGEGRSGEALELFDRAIDAGFETDFLYHLRAWAFFNLGITEGAIESWSRAIELNPENYEFWMERGLRKYDLNDFPGAIEDLLVAREYGPDQWSVFEALGEVYYFSGQDQYFGEAHEAFDRAIELEPTNPKSRQMRAELKWFRNGDAEAALEDINIAVEYTDPGNPAPLDVRGTIFLETGQFELCIPDYNRALEISPEEPWYFLKRGDCFAGLGDMDAARADYERFIEFAGNNPEFNDLVARVQEWLGEH